MRVEVERAFKMQTYERIGSKLDQGEPAFTPEVVRSMRVKFGADADQWLAKLRWAGDHWFFNKDRMYHGVEPDGYIHT